MLCYSIYQDTDAQVENLYKRSEVHAKMLCYSIYQDTIAQVENLNKRSEVHTKMLCYSIYQDTDVQVEIMKKEAKSTQGCCVTLYSRRLTHKDRS